MNSRPTGKESDEPDVESLIAFAQDYFAADFPNPERLACPSPLTLRSLARSGNLPDDELCSHLFGCSECFSEYRAALEAGRAGAPAIAAPWWAQWRERWSAAFSPKTAFAAGVVILIVISTAVWLAWREAKKPEAPSVTLRQPESAVTSPAISTAPTPAPPPPRATKRSSPELIAQVRVKLADYQTLRDVARTDRGERKPIELPASRARLVIGLPERSVKGLYVVSVVDADGDTLKTGKGRSPDGKTLTLLLDLSGLSGKAWRLSVGRRDEAPYFYPVVISNPKATLKQ